MNATASRREGEPVRGAQTAVLVIDMLNDYCHDDGEALAQSARKIVPNIAALISRARDEGVLVVHVNDNHGRWSADRAALIELARGCGEPALIDPIVPAADAPFVFKARHSVFYGSSLEYLLDRHDIGRLILTGQVTEQCILYSALDAYIRHYEVVVAQDAVAHIDADLAGAALELIRRNMRGTIVTCDDALAERERPAEVRG